jgi:hypothetical protein
VIDVDPLNVSSALSFTFSPTPSRLPSMPRQLGGAVMVRVSSSSRVARVRYRWAMEGMTERIQEILQKAVSIAWEADQLSDAEHDDALTYLNDRRKLGGDATASER